MADVTDLFYAGEAIHGYGAQLMVGQDDGSPETFVSVADVSVITPGDMSTAVIERTHLRSPEAHREKIPGMRDSGPFAFSGNWRPKHGSQSNAGGDGFTGGGLVALWRTRAIRNFQIMVPDGSPSTAWPFRGFISKFQPGEIGIDGIIPFSGEVTPGQDFSADLP